MHTLVRRHREAAKTEGVGSNVIARSVSTDLYQLTMMAGYVATGRHEVPATFELFVRRLPPHRRYLIAAGLSSAVEYLRELRFLPDEIEWLRQSGYFKDVSGSFFEFLQAVTFTGDVWAMPEGTPLFPNEPILRVTAPLAQAQLAETALLAIVNYQTSVASKAARIVHAAAGRPVLEFGARRAHGPAAALFAARAAFVGGCSGTSYVEAGLRFGIPLSGTMAHSWVLAARNERGAFEEYMSLFGPQSVLLIDTFDTLRAAKMIVDARLRPPAVRLDSGDLLALSRGVRQIFDAGGLAATRIIATGDLDEWKIAALLRDGAPIDAFGVGTSLTTSEDAPALGGVYKLVQIEEDGGIRNVMKLSDSKATWPGRKQVWRVYDEHGASDVVGVDHESPPPGGEPLLEQVLVRGEPVSHAPSLASSRERAQRMLARLRPELLNLDSSRSFDVRPSPVLRALIDAGTASVQQASTST
jgi:nicotinate phosphoribosyltransferase